MRVYLVQAMLVGTRAHALTRTRGHVPQVIEYIDVRGGGKCTRNVEVGAFAIDPFQCKR